MKHIIVDKVRYQNDGFAIVVAHDDSGKSDVYTGNLPTPEVNAEYEVECEETTHPKYGRQYKITECRFGSSAPANPDSVLNFLLSGVIPGCGPSTAQKIYDAFGDESLNVIRNEWNKLETINGISQKKAQQIHDGEQNVTSSASLLGLPGISISKAKKIYATYGDKATSVIKENPYQLVYDIDGFSFKTADAIALQNGMSNDNPKRIAGAITFVLYDINKEGHCYCGKKKLLDRAEELLGIARDIIETELENEVANGHVIIDGRSVYAKMVYDMENETAAFLMSLVKKQGKFGMSAVRYTLQSLSDVDITNEQRDAVLGALSQSVYAITGGAGTGKTTVIKTIARVYKALCNNPIVMCAPTGKAARRMTEATGCKAMTTARLAITQSEHPRDALIICDEASMLDLQMAHDLMQVAVNGNNQIVFVGDVNQLPPVGAGTFFRDILESGIVHKNYLMTCHRQSGNIAANATKINSGAKLSSLVFDGSTTKFVPGNTVEDAIAEYKRAVAKYGIKNVCLLLPFRQARGTVPATSTANLTLRPAYNPNQSRPGCKFADGDRVLNLVNDPSKDIANGDVGTVVYSSKEDNLFVVQMDSGVEVTYPHEGEYQFDLAYALTIHKSQGSEYDCVIILLTTAAFIMLERNLVYTAVTRGKQEVIMLGDKKAYGMALNTQKAIKRNTKLIERMQALQ